MGCINDRGCKYYYHLIYCHITIFAKTCHSLDKCHEMDHLVKKSTVTNSAPKLRVNHIWIWVNNCGTNPSHLNIYLLLQLIAGDCHLGMFPFRALLFRHQLLDIPSPMYRISVGFTTNYPKPIGQFNNIFR